MRAALLAVLLALSFPAAAQKSGGKAPPPVGGASYATIPAPSGCAAGYVPYFDAALKLVCSPTVYAPATDTTTFTGTVAARNLTATALATPGGITVTPTLSQIGGITVVAGASLADGDALSVGDGVGVVPIEFDFAPGDGTTGGAVPIIFDGTETATQIRDAVKAILDASGRDWTTSAQGADGIGIVRATPGATGGAITEDVADAGFTVTDWTDPTHAMTVTYQLVACLADGSCTEAGADSTTGASVANLTASNLNRLTWSAVSGAASYKVYRSVAPTSPATVGIIYSGTALAVDDTGLVGDTTTAPTVDDTGVLWGDGLRLGTSAVAGHVLTADANGYYTPQAGGGGATPGGEVGQLQFRGSEGFAGVAGSAVVEGATPSVAISLADAESDTTVGLSVSGYEAALSAEDVTAGASARLSVSLEGLSFSLTLPGEMQPVSLEMQDGSLAIALHPTWKIFQIANLPVFADNAAALAGGLWPNFVYSTPTGEIRIVVQP